MFDRTSKIVVSSLVGVALMSLVTLPPSAEAAGQNSGSTIAWDSESRDQTSIFYEEFKNLEVSVSQTNNLTSQGISVSWSGMNPGIPGNFSRNYMQIMQCWGSDSGPTPQQCQWGGSSAATANLLGQQAAARDLNIYEDPKQSYDTSFLIPPPRNLPNQRAYRVPFLPVEGVNDFEYGKYFDSASSNEVTAAVIGADGTGLSVFEVQTVFEAPHLGCGADTSNGPQSCWLVVVPRGFHNANGHVATEEARLTGSPLSQSNWENRIQVKLEFNKISAVCPIGNSERRLVGNDMVGAAVTSWQPALCKNNATYGFSQIGDSEARAQLVSNSDGVAGLGLIDSPISEEALGENKVVYAPMAQSAIVIGFNIDRNLKNSASNYNKYGTLVESLTLNARLVAKLLTQSYKSDVPGGNDRSYLANNPRSIVQDPEFVNLNPEFAGFNNGIEPQGLLVSLGASDVNAQIWSWLRSDTKAASFLSGTPDEWGMVVNQYYLSLDLKNDLALESFPKADLSYYRPNLLTPEPGFGTLDLRPYMTDMLEAALAIRRSDSKSKTVWDLNKTPPAFTSSGGQAIGEHFQLGITNYASALRYNLGIAKLVDSAGNAVEVNQSSISAGIADMKLDTKTGVRLYDPTMLSANSYPLSTLTYAAVAPCRQSNQALAEYSDFLKFAAGVGQVSGNVQGSLPAGYVPLNSDQKAELNLLASQITKAEIKSGCPIIEGEDPTEEIVPGGETPIDGGGVTPGVVDRADVTNVFATFSKSPFAANLAIFGASVLGIPGFLVGRWLLGSARFEKNSRTRGRELKV